jgi:hypothetical protein
MPQQKLNLFQFTTSKVTQAGAGAAIMPISA